MPGGVSSASLEGFPETGRLGRQMSGLGCLAVPDVLRSTPGSPEVAGGGGGR